MYSLIRKMWSTESFLGKGQSILPIYELILFTAGLVGVFVGIVNALNDTTIVIVGTMIYIAACVFFNGGLFRKIVSEMPVIYRSSLSAKLSFLMFTAIRLNSIGWIMVLIFLLTTLIITPLKGLVYCSVTLCLCTLLIMSTCVGRSVLKITSGIVFLVVIILYTHRIIAEVHGIVSLLVIAFVLWPKIIAKIGVYEYARTVDIVVSKELNFLIASLMWLTKDRVFMCVLVVTQMTMMIYFNYWQGILPFMLALALLEIEVYLQYSVERAQTNSRALVLSKTSIVSRIYYGDLLYRIFFLIPVILGYSVIGIACNKISVYQVIGSFVFICLLLYVGDKFQQRKLVDRELKPNFIQEYIAVLIIMGVLWL